MSEKSSVLFASKAEIGQEYTTVNGKQNTVVVISQKDDRTILKVKIPGYKYDQCTPMSVPGTYLLRPIANGGDMKKEIKEATAKKGLKAEKAIKTPRPERAKTEAVEGRKRLPKMDKNHPLERIVISGITFRKDYRAQSNAQRIADCEKAKKDKCGCRCAGVLHGKSHDGMVKWEADAFQKRNGPVPAQDYVNWLKQNGKWEPKEKKVKVSKNS